MATLTFTPHVPASTTVFTVRWTKFFTNLYYCAPRVTFVWGQMVRTT